MMDWMEFLPLPLSDPIAVFAVMLLALFLAPMLFERLKLPGILGLLLAGVLVGPGVLGILEPKGLVELMGTAGMAYVVFLAGVETDLGLLRKSRGQGLSLGLLLFALPFAAGAAAGLWVLGLEPLPALLFGSIFSSHALITYPIVSKLGLARSKPATAAVAATILTDALAIVVLALVSSSARGQWSLAFWLRFAGLSALLVAFGLLVLPRASALFFRRMKPDGSIEFVYVLTVLFALCFLARLAGLEPILGAFLAGIALNPLIPQKSALMNRISFVGNNLFVPFFLVSAGMMVDLRGFEAAGAGLYVPILMLAVVLAGKALPALYMRLRYRYGWAEAGLVFGMTVNKAAITLAAVMVGYRLGLLPEPVLSGAVLMILVTCGIGAIVTSANARSLARNSAAGQERERESGERAMVMVANPEHAKGLVDLSSLLSPPDSHEPIYPVKIVQDSAGAEAAITVAENLLAQVVAHGAGAGLNVIPVTRVSFNVSEGIVQSAKDVRASAIVAGAGAGSALMKRPYGPVIEQIVATTAQMVLVYRSEQAVKLFSHIVAVVPPMIERQGGFPRAATAIKNLARAIKARVTLASLDQALPGVTAEWDKARPRLQAQGLSAPDWKSLQSELRRHGSSQTLFALFSVRAGTLAWQPAVDRLPLKLLEDMPTASLLCVYLPEAADEPSADESAAPSAPARDLLSAAAAEDRALFWKQPLAIADAVRALTGLAFSADRAAQARLSALFVDIAQREPVELKPGIVLLHAHVGEVDKPLILFGLSKAGIPLLSLQEKIRLLVVLIAPESQAPEDHLKVLARIASEAMAPGFTGRIESVGSQADLEAL